MRFVQSLGYTRNPKQRVNYALRRCMADEHVIRMKRGRWMKLAEREVQ